MLQTANIIAELLDLNDDGDVDDPTAANFIDHRVNNDLGRSSPVMPNPNSNPNPNPNPYPYPNPNPDPDPYPYPNPNLGAAPLGDRAAQGRDRVAG